MGKQVTDLEYVEDLLTDFDLRPTDKIADLIEALEAEDSDDESGDDEDEKSDDEEDD
jgi:hypothetical protein